jgi:hypothetical protein
MIHYELRCERFSHEFDGWFAGSAAFEEQAARGLIACPHCGESAITRALMAPRLARKGAAKVIEAEAVPAAEKMSVPVKPAAGLPEPLRAALHALRAEVEKHCDYVGENFAEEVRKIHYGEAAPRGIFGEATAEESEALADEGIEVARIPWVPRTDS